MFSVYVALVVDSVQNSPHVQHSVLPRTAACQAVTNKDNFFCFVWYGRWSWVVTAVGRFSVMGEGRLVLG